MLYKNLFWPILKLVDFFHQPSKKVNSLNYKFKIRKKNEYNENKYPNQKFIQK